MGVATLWMILFTAVAAMLWMTLFTAVPLWTTQGMVTVTVACMAAVLDVVTTMTAWATVIVVCLAADTAWVQHLWMMHLFGSRPCMTSMISHGAVFPAEIL